MTIPLYIYAVAILAALVAIYLLVRLRKLQAYALSTQRELYRLKLTLELSEGVGRFGSWHLDKVTEKIWWSDYVFEMHHRPRSQGEPSLEDAIGYYHPDDQSLVRDAANRSLMKGEDVEFRARILTDSGSELPVLTRGTCQFGQDGEVIGIFGCFVDLSKLGEQ